MGNKIWIFLIIVLFSVVYQLSGGLVYVDGDDATSIAYHLLGRDPVQQRPYSPYHGMMDKALSIIPAQENLLRTIAFGSTRLATIIMVILILQLAFDWMQTSGMKLFPAWQVLVSCILLLAVPELFYFGLVYSPSLIAMCLVLSAHLVLRWISQNGNLPENRKLLAYSISIILFGLGVSFRWNVITYGLVITADLLISPSSFPSTQKRLLATASWGVFALLSSYLMIYLSGYGYADILAEYQTILFVVKQAGTLSTAETTSLKEILMRSALTLSPLLSPIFALTVFIGFVKLIMDKNKLWTVVLAGILSILPWIRSGVPKFIITILPVLILIFSVGLIAIANYMKQKKIKTVVYAVLFLGLLFPWVIGIRVQLGDTAWGPGFDIKPYDYAEVTNTSFGLAFGSGMAFPTPEGPRPLYGHAFVLLAGEWKEFVTDREAERQTNIDEALKLGIPLVITSWSPDYYLNDLYAMGFQTSDPYTRMTEDGYFRERRLTNPQGGTISLLFHETRGEDILDVFAHIQESPISKQFVIEGYSQTIRVLYEDYPNALKAIGPGSAAVDLSE